MRPKHLLWAALPAVAVAAMAALASPTGHATTRAPAAVKHPSPAPQAPEADDDGDGPERMDGPDAWDGLGMGPAGLGFGGPRGAPRAGPGMRMHAMRARRAELEQALGLTSEQRERMQVIRDRRLREGIERRAKLQIAALDLESMLLAERTDRAGIEAKIDAIARLRAEQTKARLLGLLEMRSVLSAGQQKQLRSLRGGR